MVDKSIIILYTASGCFVHSKRGGTLMWSIGFGSGEKTVESLFVLRIIFHKTILSEDDSNLIQSLFKEFSSVVDFRPIDFTNGKVEYRAEFKDTCVCQKSALGWNLILFFADRWQEVEKAEIEYDGKKVKIFPIDVGMCS